MNTFEQIKLNQLLTFSEIVNNTTLFEKEFIEKKYIRKSTNFNSTFDFLKILGLIATKNKQIILKSKYKTFLKELNKKNKNQFFRAFFLNELLGKKSDFSYFIYDFLMQFNLINNKYEFKPTITQRLKYSGLRNLFMELNFLYLNPTIKKYIISDDYFLFFKKLIESYNQQLDKFLKNIKNKEEIGKAAELEIIQYEKNRLSLNPFLIEKIEHIAIKDVGAGYDIKSFNIRKGKNGNPTSRYIEVKAVSPWDYSFYLTRNEVEKSRLYKNNYYLYLLPVIGKEKFDIIALRIIKDPYLKVYKNKKEWFKTEELFSFSLNKGLKK